jgi:CBS domain-containing protein
MQRNIGIVDAKATLEDLERVFAEAGVSGFPVVEDGRVVGVISRTDVLRQLARKEGGSEVLSTFYADLGSVEQETGPLPEFAARLGHEASELRVEDLMTRWLVSVGPESSLEDVARALVEHRIHRVLVSDDGTVVGIVSSLDLVRLLAEGQLSPS